MEEHGQKQVEYRLSKMDIARFDIYAENDQAGEAEFQTQVQFAYDNNQNCMLCRLLVNIVQQEKNLIESELDCYFEFSPNSVETLKQEENIVIPAPILIQFASLCYGTMRGVIFTKTIGTSLNRFILIPLYFHEIIRQDFIAKL